MRLMAKHYGVPVVLHSDHCAKVGGFTVLQERL